MNLAKLRFDPTQIEYWADRYDYPIDDIVSNLKISIQEQKFLTKTDLLTLAQWKSPRSTHHINKNQESYIEAITHFALSTSNKRARIQSLTILDGVGWPMASCILHFYHHQPYPILDFRALWSISIDIPSQYSFDFWIDYVQYCRQLAKSNQISMRKLDCALWQYSKENQST